VHVAASLAADRRRRARGIPDDLHSSQAGHMKKAGLLLAGAVPLGAYALSRMNGGRSSGLSVLGSVSLLAGGYMLRHATLKLGMESAKNPQAHFRFAQPENLPRRSRPMLEDRSRRQARLP
jgi:protein NrfD